LNFLEFLKYIPKLKDKELPGLEAQFKLAPKIRKQFTPKDLKNSNPKKAAVLVLIFPNKDNETNLLLTKRATYNGNHSAQISFPGGKVEENDTSIIDTALREANEEIGVDIENVKIIRKATENYIPPSNFLVTPVLGYVEKTPQFVTNYEVDEIISVSLNDLFNDDKQVLKEMTTSYMKNIEVPCYLFNNHIVWGATAMILSEIKELLKQSIYQ
jgi:8-oxo-dGTP pyrophosphatase MutT (NUDIX family)